MTENKKIECLACCHDPVYLDYAEDDKTDPLHSSYGPRLMALIDTVVGNTTPGTSEEWRFGMRLLYEAVTILVRFHVKRGMGDARPWLKEQMDYLTRMAEVRLGVRDAALNVPLVYEEDGALVCQMCLRKMEAGEEHKLVPPPG